jgi:bidirectional [NiFe] hydrogenase diaphorase subunit
MVFMVSLVVDGKDIQAEEGRSLLQVCLENEIYIPNLCFLKEMENPTGSCRLCIVEIEGEAKPLTSCRVKVREGMVVRTDTPTIRQLQRIDFQLLMTAHHMDCKNCLSKRCCELQKIAKLLGIRLKDTKFEQLARLNLAVIKHPCFDLLPARCILCRKCLFVCGQLNPEPLLKLARKGFEHVIEIACEDDPEKLPCKDCQACLKVCPVSAIVPIGGTPEKKKKVKQTEKGQMVA